MNAAPNDIFRKNMMEDILTKELKLIICGTAIGNATNQTGHYYADPTNQFWNTLYRVGLTHCRLTTSEDHSLLNYSIGLTDLVKDQHGNDNEIQFNTIQRNELVKKIEENKPRILCFNGKNAAKQYFNCNRVCYGLCDEKIGDTLVFIAPSTSGSARKFWDIDYWFQMADLANDKE